MVLIAASGAVVVSGHGLDFRLPAEIRAMANVPTQSASWRFHECLLDLSHEMEFAETCVDRDRRPLVLVWGDSTAGALLPGLCKAQEAKNFGIAQFTSASCVPALNVDVADAELPRDQRQVLSLAQQLKPKSCCCGTWEGSRQRRFKSRC
jgi:hypothetical protein